MRHLQKLLALRVPIVAIILIVAPMFWWKANADVKLTKLLVQHVESLNQKENVDISDINRIIFLINEGAQADLVIENRSSALGSAVRFNLDVDVVRLLLENSSSIGLSHYRKQGLLEWAVKNNNVRLVRELSEKGLTPSSVDYCCELNTGKPLLLNAALVEKTEMMELLVELGANLNSSYRGRSLLESVINSFKFDSAIWLIEKGVKSRNDELLHKAIARATPKRLVKLLVFMGYYPNDLNNRGESAIEYARRHQKYSLVKVLENLI